MPPLPLSRTQIDKLGKRLIADSRPAEVDELRRTHGRYFYSLVELAERIG